MVLFSFLTTAGGLPPDVQNLWTFKTWAAVLSALLIWLAFVLLGIAARNYQKVLRQTTEWQFLVIAPSGILIYAVIQAVLLVTAGKYRLVGTTGYIGYGLFLVSAVITLIGTLRFYGVIKGKRKKRQGR
ncbi:hypothetical protein JW890_01195 [candidate division WOR-3 bacterium]|nr:hypothetical protein [candidate division WOR-3 bacterium]